MVNKFVTIHDVAADAVCSTATVSRALNEPWKVSDETRERVRTSVERLGYKPNIRARLLAQGANGGTICFLLSNRQFMHSVHSQILQGAASIVESSNTQILYATCNYSPNFSQSEISMPQILGARGMIDGIILAGTNYPNVFSALDELHLPYVVYGTNLVAGDDSSINNAVYVDDEGGGYLATKHLIELGHTNIRFIGDISLPWYRRRYLGYQKAVTEAGLSCEMPTGSASESELKMGYNAATGLCDRNLNFTALFVGGDTGAVGAIKALEAKGLNIPGDVSVVGFNDEEIAHLWEPPLTTVSVPNEEAGAHCVKILQDIMNGQKISRPVVLPTELVIRESTRKISD